MRAVFKAATSLAGQPTDRPPKDMGFVHSPWAMRRYRVERERPLSDFTDGKRRMVLGMLEPLGALLNMRPFSRTFEAIKPNSAYHFPNSVYLLRDSTARGICFNILRMVSSVIGAPISSVAAASALEIPALL